jgi:trigger factor
MIWNGKGSENMKVEVEQLGPIRKKMSVALPPELVDREVEKAYLKLQREVRLKGFRPGRAPRALLQRYFKAQVEEDVISALVQDSYPRALDENKCLPVSQPVIEKGVLEKGKEFCYTASFEIKPVLDVTGYQGLQLEKAKLNVTDLDIEQQLKNLQDSHATLKAVEGREARSGDCVVIDAEGSIEGKPFDGSSLKNHLLEIAPESFLPGFSDQLIGMKAGQEKVFPLAVPEGYARDDMTGKTIDFKVHLQQIKEKILPVLDDEFARDLGAYADLAELKEKIRTSLTAQRQQQIQADLKEKIAATLIENNAVEVPPAMIEQQIRNMIVSMQQRLHSQGLNFENFPYSIEKLSEIYREPAEKQVRTSLLLEAIAEKEHISVSEEDIENRYREIAQSLNQNPAAVRKSIEPDLIKAQLLEEKALDFIITHATITEI